MYGCRVAAIKNPVILFVKRVVLGQEFACEFDLIQWRGVQIWITKFITK